MLEPKLTDKALTAPLFTQRQNEDALTSCELQVSGGPSNLRRQSCRCRQAPRTTEFGDAALEEAMDYQTKEYLVKKLLDRGANPNAEHVTQGNMLQFSIGRCKEETIRHLLDAGADINAIEGEYGTALQAAVIQREESL